VFDSGFLPLGLSPAACETIQNGRGLWGGHAVLWSASQAVDRSGVACG